MRRGRCTAAPGDFSQAYGSGCGLALHSTAASTRGRRSSVCRADGGRDYCVDGDAVLGVHHDESAVAVARSMARRMSLSVE